MPEFTPMMNHYLQIKEKYPDTLIFYRLGDFYELFFADAETASHELDLVLTGRNAGQKDKVPMCGVPHHAVNSYIQRLISRGHKVAIVEQLEDPAEAVGLVKRDVIRVITPGTIVDGLGDERASVYLGALYDYQYGVTIALAELATGQTSVFMMAKDDSEIIQFLKTKNVRELIVPAASSGAKAIRKWARAAGVTISECDDEQLKPDYRELLGKIEDPRIVSAFARLTNYLEATQKQAVTNLEPLVLARETDSLYMDYATKQNLELTNPLRTSAGAVTLWSFLDHCRSSLGSRLLKRWVEYPLVRQAEIEQRLDMVAYLNKEFRVKEDLGHSLGNIYDLERLVSRIALGNLNAKDCLRLHKTLTEAPKILRIIRDAGIYPDIEEAADGRAADELIKDAFVDDPPILTNEGGMFRDGYDPKLDELRLIQRDGKQWIAAFEAKEKEKTGIRNLKIGYNRVFGYYIEISNGNLSLVRDEWGYIRKQTLTNGERFVTTELKEKEDEILHAEERAVKYETDLFAKIAAALKGEIKELQKLSKSLALADALYSLAAASDHPGYVRPCFNDRRRLAISGGRHPILETARTEEPYIANDVLMDPETNILIITGPNMGGKSTYMRQTILIILMAQIGCFVPAKKAELPLFDKVFTRIGASDDLLSGQSTFMVEMNEANQALKNATKDSFILFDEIGRGTATYDGMSLAQAILEYISACIGAKTMFSTHYHELTGLEDTDSSIKNVHVAVNEHNEEITFLYKIKDGPADRSYGINVAKLARLPESVLARAKKLLKILESQQKSKINAQSQLVMMEKIPDNLEKIAESLQKVDPDRLTPLEALQLVVDLKALAAKKEAK